MRECGECERETRERAKERKARERERQERDEKDSGVGCVDSTQSLVFSALARHILRNATQVATFTHHVYQSPSFSRIVSRENAIKVKWELGTRDNCFRVEWRCTYVNWEQGVVHKILKEYKRPTRDCSRVALLWYGMLRSRY